ncbi:hypothetical protein IB265_34715 [Ensifer sp. ENS10]|uniref:hypothetical protein n=1 Tax=Ensifer sp. ENS10 TaxID=2769286 RepID=UPI00177FBA02|nr:hypothetical protein [Ensifer sp. ENS10]MBD9511904.1 hypothetical protein [Ensifer sp. ENS10]
MAGMFIGIAIVWAIIIMVIVFALLAESYPLLAFATFVTAAGALIGWSVGN